MTRLAIIALMLLPFTAAHFTILTPTPLGTDDANQNDSPCGGYTPNLDSTVTVHADGEAFSVRTAHPQSNWLIRATLNGNAGGDWVQMYPIFQQSGIGTFCIPTLKVPPELVGHKGVIGLVGNGADGMLYGCIAANFVNGIGQTSDSCINSTTVSLSFDDDADLTALLGATSGTSANNSDGNDINDDSGSSGFVAPMAGALCVVAFTIMMFGL